MTVGDRIKQKRIENEYSQSDLARLANFNDKTAISKIEHAGDDISLKNVRRIAKALNISPAYLMGWEESYDSVIDNYTEAEDEKFQMESLYYAYVNAAPEIQHAIETLLKLPPQIS